MPIRSDAAKPARVPLEALPGAVCTRAKELARLRDALAATMDEEEVPHFLGVSANAAELVIFADSPAWCMRLRYRAPEFEAAAQALLGRVPRLVFRSQPPRFAPAEAPRRRTLSERAVQTLLASARTVGDPTLAAALRRLAGRKP